MVRRHKVKDVQSNSWKEDNSTEVVATKTPKTGEEEKASPADPGPTTTQWLCDGLVHILGKLRYYFLPFVPDWIGACTDY
jgi:hypothetical protein